MKNRYPLCRKGLHSLRTRLQTGSVLYIVSRICSILMRYGFTSRRFGELLYDFIALLRRYGVKPTLPVTASVLKRHPHMFQSVQSLGAEFAIHGYRHVDYTLLTPEEIAEHLHQAENIFRKYNISYSGYRFPYLRSDASRIDQLALQGFQWDSSEAISWNSLDPRKFDKREWKLYQRILQTYNASDADTSFALPFIRKGLVEIPVSVPDDDILIERLGLNDDELMKKIWEKMIRRIRERGELLVLQVHPERFRMYRHALEHLLILAKNWNDGWFATLDEICTWWKERHTFRFDVRKISNNRYRISAFCTDRATIEILNGSRERVIPSQNADRTSKVKEWEMKCSKKPVIGIDPKTPAEVAHFIKSEGYAYEITEDPEECAVFLKECNQFTITDRHHLLRSIAKVQTPLIRFMRWPDRMKYGLSITGDIDGVDLWDFWGRFHG